MFWNKQDMNKKYDARGRLSIFGVISVVRPNITKNHLKYIFCQKDKPTTIRKILINIIFTFNYGRLYILQNRKRRNTKLQSL